MGSGSSLGSQQAAIKPISTGGRGYYICSRDSSHRISWEIWHNDMLFPESEQPDACTMCKGTARFIWHPTEPPKPPGLPDFVPPDMEGFINGILG